MSAVNHTILPGFITRGMDATFLPLLMSIETDDWVLEKNYFFHVELNVSWNLDKYQHFLT